jgi:hypothetical protein
VSPLPSPRRASGQWSRRQVRVGERPFALLAIVPGHGIVYRYRDLLPVLKREAREEVRARSAGVGEEGAHHLLRPVAGSDAVTMMEPQVLRRNGASNRAKGHPDRRVTRPRLSMDPHQSVLPQTEARPDDHMG